MKRRWARRIWKGREGTDSLCSTLPELYYRDCQELRVSYDGPQQGNQRPRHHTFAAARLKRKDRLADKKLPQKKWETSAGRAMLFLSATCAGKKKNGPRNKSRE